MITFGRYRLSFSKALTFGFLIVIAIGTLLLMLPIAIKPGEDPSFMTAFFYRDQCNLRDWTDAG